MVSMNSLAFNSLAWVQTPAPPKVPIVLHHVLHIGPGWGISGAVYTVDLQPIEFKVINVTSL